MNNTISVYELLGLIKDGKAPKLVKYDIYGNIRNNLMIILMMKNI